MKWRIISIGMILLLVLCGCSEDTAKTRRTLCISEVQASGGEHDWVELYNYGTEPLSLHGWYLSDDPDSPGKYPLPALVLAAGERVVLTTDSSAAHSLGFRLSARGETVVLTSPEGHTAHTVEVPPSVAGLSYGCVENGTYPPVDFVWYAAPTPAASNADGAQLGTNTTAEQYGVRINEYVTRCRTSLYDAAGDYGDWLELYNTTDHTVDLSGWTVTDADNPDARWAFPAGTQLPAGGYLLVFCDGKNTVTDGEYHTDFRLGENDGFVALYTADGAFCSGVTCKYDSSEQDIAYGCTADGTVAQLRYPTPGAPNAAEVTA